MTELELCLLSQSALMAKIRKLQRINKSRMIRLREARQTIAVLRGKSASERSKTVG